MTLEELQEIARIEIAANDAHETPDYWEIASLHDISDEDAKRVVELIKTATVEITWPKPERTPCPCGHCASMRRGWEIMAKSANHEIGGPVE